MIGCCPVFDNENDATKFADGKFPIFKINLYDVGKENKNECK